MTNAIEFQDLEKTYSGSRVRALDGITLNIKEGQFFGLLGPNGAGKTTAIGILSSLIIKSKGLVKIMGLNLDGQSYEARRFLGIVPQEFNFNIFEPLMDIVLNQAGFYGMPRPEATERANELFKALGLWDKRFQPALRLSGGMKRRLMIARAMIHNPKILILDEPTAGVDISLRRTMWQTLKTLNKKGLTILLTTHYLEEAEQLCDQIAIIDKGKIVENLPTEQLLSKLKVETLILFTDFKGKSLSIQDCQIRISHHGRIEVDLPVHQSLSQLIMSLNEQGVEVKRVQNKANRLEALFLKMTNNGNTDDTF